LRLPLTVNVGETEAVLAFFFFFADVRRGAKADPVIVRVLLSRVALLVAELRRVLLGDTGEPGASVVRRLNECGWWCGKVDELSETELRLGGAPRALDGHNKRP